MSTYPEQRPTPLLDRATVARITTDDLDLTENELVALSDPAVRFALGDCLHGTVAWEVVLEEGLRRWRAQRDDDA